jgi:aminodeoxyfutalosine synthase
LNVEARIKAAGLAEIDGKLRANVRLTLDDGVALFNSPDLLAVGALANREREKRHGAPTSL